MWLDQVNHQLTDAIYVKYTININSEQSESSSCFDSFQTGKDLVLILPCFSATIQAILYFHNTSQCQMNLGTPLDQSIYRRKLDGLWNFDLVSWQFFKLVYKTPILRSNTLLTYIGGLKQSIWRRKRMISSQKETGARPSRHTLMRLTLVLREIQTF